MSTPPSNDSDLRSLFDDAVSDVHPEGGTSEIRARAGRPSAGRWVPLTVAAAVATVVVIVGGAWLAQQQSGNAPAAGPGAAPHEEPTSQPSSDDGARSMCPSTTWAARPRGRACSPRRTGSRTRPGIELQAAVAGGPERVTARPRLQTRLPRAEASTATRIRRRRPDHDRPVRTTSGATVACRGGGTAGGAVAGLDGARRPPRASRPVRFTVDGQPADRGARRRHLRTGAAGQRRLESSSAVSIATPAEGAAVPTRFEVTGQAATFEANVVWELKRGEEVVRQRLHDGARVLHPVAVLLRGDRPAGRLHPRRPRHRRVRRRGHRHQRGHQAHHGRVAALTARRR